MALQISAPNVESIDYKNAMMYPSNHILPPPWALVHAALALLITPAQVLDIEIVSWDQKSNKYEDMQGMQ